MPFAARSGVECVRCGRSIHIMSQAIADLPDPFFATCSFCEHKASYPKSSIHLLWGTPNGDGFGTVKIKSAIPNWQMLGVFVLIAVLMVIAGIIKSGGYTSTSFASWLGH